jgi:hypothetical protein
MVSSRLCQMLYVEEEEGCLEVNCCHVRHKGALPVGNELVNSKNWEIRIWTNHL